MSLPGSPLATFDDQRVICGNEIERGDPPIDPWVPETTGYDGSVADKRGQGEVTITVEDGPNGYQHTPPVVFVDPGTTVTWKWTQEDGEHYIVHNNRWMHDSDIPDPGEGPQSFEHPDVGMRRWACAEHGPDGERTTVIAVSPEEEYSFACNDCGDDTPEGDGIGHTGGDSPWT
jgi:plastocyanin